VTGTPGASSALQASDKKKKARTTFTGRQIFELEKQFEQKKYLSLSERARMAALLSVTETQVRELYQLLRLCVEMWVSQLPGVSRNERVFRTAHAYNACCVVRTAEIVDKTTPATFRDIHGSKKTHIT